MYCYADFVPFFNPFLLIISVLHIECIWMVNILFLNKTSLGLICIVEWLDLNIGKHNYCIFSDLNNNEFTFKFVCYALCVKDYSIQHTSDKKKFFQIFDAFFYFWIWYFNFLYVFFIRYKIMFSYLGSRDWLHCLYHRSFRLSDVLHYSPMFSFH